MARVRLGAPLLVDELVVREYTLEDAEALDAALTRNREYLLPWVGAWIKEEPIGLPARRARIAEWIASYEAGLAESLGIFDHGRLVGSTGFHDRNGERDTEIGYWVDAQQQGRGIATRVSSALIAHAFASPQVDRVLLKHVIGNTGSHAIAERLGFTLLPGENCDCDAPTLTWALTRDAWEKATR